MRKRIKGLIRIPNPKSKRPSPLKTSVVIGLLKMTPSPEMKENNPPNTSETSSMYRLKRRANSIINKARISKRMASAKGTKSGEAKRPSIMSQTS